MVMRRNLFLFCLILCVLLPLATYSYAQEECSSESINEELKSFIEDSDYSEPGDAIHAMVLNLFTLAQECVYIPDSSHISQYLDYLLQHISFQEIMATRRVGINVTEVLDRLSEVRGDPLRGLTLYNGEEVTFSGSYLTCLTCHNGIIGPPTEGSYTRVIEERLPNLPEYTALLYFVESLLLPEEYITPGYSNALMPQNLGDVLDIQDLADLIAYMESQDQELSD